MFSERMRGNACIFLAAVMWSTGGLLIKYVPWNGIVINGVRNLIAFAFFLVVKRRFKPKLNRSVLMAGVGLALVTILFSISNKLTTAANAIVLQYMMPIFVLIMSCIKERRLPDKKRVGIVAMTFVGVVLFFCDQLSPGNMLGNVLAILSGVAFACVFFFNAAPDGNSDDASMLGFLIAGLIGLPFIFIYRPEVTVSSGLAVAALGLVQVGLAYLVFGMGIGKTDAVTSSLIAMIEAILNPVWVLIFMHEKPGFFAIIGSVIILTAVALNIVLSGQEDNKADGV